MVLTLAPNPQNQALSSADMQAIPFLREIVVFCPGCKTLETVWLNDGHLMPTRKFKQLGKQVFHDCGTSKPCRLYHTY